jgi:hypothetical protein
VGIVVIVESYSGADEHSNRAAAYWSRGNPTFGDFSPGRELERLRGGHTG